ncbi:hypothetical protein HKX48_004380 [Thoreauomyces humboldtii]|nr:hypothetical protein HKX48_004380 [Thoreauomyces humboldtii]
MKLSSALIAVAGLATSFTEVFAWGSQGHEVVGSIAASLVKPATLKAIESILASGETLESIAPWADTVKYARGNGDWHFIDVNVPLNPQSDPTNSKKTCTPNMARDCSGTGNTACIVTVIDEQAAILKGPLHACGYLKGGNGSPVSSFDTQTATQYGAMELHWIWDTSILLKAAGGRTTAKGQTVTDAQMAAYTATLLTRVKSGDLHKSAGQWTSCTNPTVGKELCALEWAGDSNGLDCSAVYVGYTATANLGGAYYAKNAPVVAQQLAKAGVRLAAFLDEVLACAGGDAPSPEPTATATEEPSAPTDEPSSGLCSNPAFPNYLYVHTYDACCSDGTATTSGYSYLCCTGPAGGPYTQCGTNGDGVRRYSTGGEFGPGQAGKRRRSIQA